MTHNPFKAFDQSYYIKDHIKNPNIIVGDYTYYTGFYHGKHFEENVWYSSPEYEGPDQLIIGKFCSIATGAIFMMAGNQGHRHDWLTTYPFFYDNKGGQWGENLPDPYLSKGSTIVGNDVWIGAEAMILAGVKIGNGAVIGARSLVTKDVEPYTIVGGNPARVIKKRFEDKTIEILQEIKWWDWPIEIIKENIHILSTPNIQQLYDIYRKYILDV